MVPRRVTVMNVVEAEGMAAAAVEIMIATELTVTREGAVTAMIMSCRGEGGDLEWGLSQCGDGF
eukprot:4235400-Pyramimonas_sp.AAC.1